MTVALTQGETVLITGINGYIAFVHTQYSNLKMNTDGVARSHIARELLQMGYNVRGTVRDKAKGEILKSSLVGAAKSTLELIVIEDMTAEGVFDDALKGNMLWGYCQVAPLTRSPGVSGIVHSAALMSLDSDPNIVVTHALRSLSSILNSAKKESSVKRFVLTSSSIAASSPAPNQKFNITKSTYNKDAVEKAWAPPPYTPFQGLYVYAAAKVQSEQEFFRYLREENAQFVGNTVLPSSVMGPVLHPSQFGSTANWILDYYKGISEFLPQMPAREYYNAPLSIKQIIN